MVIVFVLTAALALFCGFVLGANAEPVIRNKALIRKKDPELAQIRQEYENFLNYDGTEQP